MVAFNQGISHVPQSGMLALDRCDLQIYKYIISARKTNEKRDKNTHKKTVQTQDETFANK